MPRAIWSGSIAFGLVNAPVKMYSAIDERDLELHPVHEKDLGTLRVRDGVITPQNMYFADEIRPTDDIVPRRLPRIEKRELEMAETLIERFTSSFDHSHYEDVYRDRLLKVIQQKRKGEEVHAEVPEEPEATPDLMDALRASVETARGTRNGRAKRASAPTRRPRRRKSSARR